MSFVRCRRYHKSWWNGAADLHISVDLLRGITAAELHNSVDLLCGTTDAELNNPVWCMHQELHTFSEDSDEPCWKIWWIKPKYNFTPAIKRFGRFSKHRSIVDFQQTLEMCIYENVANFYKMNALRRQQTSANVQRWTLYWRQNNPRTSANAFERWTPSDTRITTWVSASKWGKT